METNVERMQILKMLEEKKITAKEASQLLDALENDSESGIIKNKIKAKWIKIKVLSDDGKTKANINLPISLVDVGLKIGRKFDPKLNDIDLEGIDLDEIIDLIKQGAEGKLVDVYDEKNNTTVEVYVE